jgi:hypothetical protein
MKSFKNGTIVELDNNKLYVVMNGKFIREEGFLFADEAGDRVIETYTIDQLDEITNPAGA